MTWYKRHQAVLGQVLLVAAAFLLLLGIMRARASYRQGLFVQDAFGYYIYLPSVFIDGDLDFWNELAVNPGHHIHDFYDVNPKTGLSANGFQIGCAVLWAPFFMAAHLIVTVLGWLGMDIPRNGFGPAYEVPVYAGAFFYGLLGLWYMRRLLEELWGRAVATTTTLYIALASALAAYLWFEPVLSHLASATLITMFFYYLHRIYRTQDRSVLGWVRVGVLLGLIAAVRVTDALVALAPAGVGIAVCLQAPASGWFERVREIGKCAVVLALTSFVVFLPQMLILKTVFGSFLPAPQAYQKTDWLEPDLFDYFFSLKRGLFVWTPLAVAAVAGLVAAVWRGPAIVRCAVPVFVAAVYFNSSIHQWWSGDSFSDRRLVDYSVILALGLGYVLSRRPQWVASYKFHLIGAALVLFNWLLMLRYFTHDLPESAAIASVSWQDFYLKTLTFPARFVEKFIL